jgi:hypothetical protein
MIRTAVMVGVGSLVLAACIPDNEAVSTSASAISTGTTCPTWACDLNAATVADGVIAYLDLAGAPNPSGVKLGQAFLGGLVVKLGVDRDRLYAFDASDPSVRFEGLALESMVIQLWHHTGVGAPELLELLVQTVYPVGGAPGRENLHFWEGDAEEPVETYDFRARRAGDPTGKFPITVCRGMGLGSEPEWGIATAFSAIVFRGDHFDDPGRTVSPAPPGDTRMNIACAGTAMAKMHLLRHTRASDRWNDFLGAWTYPTTPDQRVTMLKAITGAYCGDGRSFTIDGTPLRWTDSGEWLHRRRDLTPGDPDVMSIEAIWGPHGVKCLEEPRLGVWRGLWPPVLSRAYVEDKCGRTIPSCSAYLPAWRAAGHVISANPW